MSIQRATVAEKATLQLLMVRSLFAYHISYSRGHSVFAYREMLLAQYSSVPVKSLGLKQQCMQYTPCSNKRAQKPFSW